MPSKPADTAKVCSYCREAKGTQKCGGCGKTRYCDNVCQQRHWKAGHRNDCVGRRKKKKKGEETGRGGQEGLSNGTAHAHPSADAGSPSTAAVGAGASGSADAACASGGGTVSSGGEGGSVAALKAASSIASMSTMKAVASAAELQQGRRQGGDDDSDSATAATGKARTSTSFPIPKTAHGHPHAEPLGPGVAVQLTGKNSTRRTPRTPPSTFR